MVDKELMEAEHKELIDKMRANADSVKVMEKMKESVEKVNEILDLDDQYPVEDASDEINVEDQRGHQHTTLKSSCPTRWNSTLTMIESVLDLKREMQNTLKRTCHYMCLTDAEFDLLSEFRAFLSHFKHFTDLYGNEMPTLSSVQLMKLKIRKLCTHDVNNDDTIRSLKRKILNNVDRRFPFTAAMKLSQLLDPDTIRATQ